MESNMESNMESMSLTHQALSAKIHLNIWMHLRYHARFRFRAVSVYFKMLFAKSIEHNTHMWLNDVTLHNVTTRIPLPVSSIIKCFDTYGIIQVLFMWRKIHGLPTNINDATLYAAVRSGTDYSILASGHTRCSDYSWEDGVWSVEFPLNSHVNTDTIWETHTEHRPIKNTGLRWKVDTFLDLFLITHNGYKCTRLEMKVTSKNCMSSFRDTFSCCMFHDHILIMIDDYNFNILDDISQTTYAPPAYKSMLEDTKVIKTLSYMSSSFVHVEHHCFSHALMDDRPTLVSLMKSICPPDA